MRHIILAWVAAVLLLGFAGCSSEPAMITRTYHLPQGDVGWEAIRMILKDEWEKHSVMSHAERRDDGVAVRTTARGHRQIKQALAEQ